MRTLLQGDQVRHDPHPLELQHVPFRASLVDLRVRQVQAQGVQDMHGEGVGRSHGTPYDDRNLAHISL